MRNPQGSHIGPDETSDGSSGRVDELFGLGVLDPKPGRLKFPQIVRPRVAFSSPPLEQRGVARPVSDLSPDGFGAEAGPHANPTGVRAAKARQSV